VSGKEKKIIAGKKIQRYKKLHSSEPNKVKKWINRRSEKIINKNLPTK